MLSTDQIIRSASLFAIVVICGAQSVIAQGRAERIDSARRDANHLRYTRLSASRPLGSPCGPGDSASVKRTNEERDWRISGYDPKADSVDSKRTSLIRSNKLELGGSGVWGYVRFDKPGYLQMRCYDDFLGDVLCGWSPSKLQLRPTKDRVFVQLATCRARSGHWSNVIPDVVHEVCWFPVGAKDGTVIFSSQHAMKERSLTSAELYTPEKFEFADGAIQEYLKSGKIAAARNIIQESRTRLADETAKRVNSAPLTGRKNGSSTNFYAEDEELAKLSMYEMGLALGTTSFESKRKKLIDVLNAQGHHFGKHETLYTDMLPVYQWLNDKVNGKSLSNNYPGDNRSLIEGEVERSEFWNGAWFFRRGDFGRASEHFSNFLISPPAEKPFEIAGAARLRELSNERSSRPRPKLHGN